jgi:hypothetical protein
MHMVAELRGRLLKPRPVKNTTVTRQHLAEQPRIVIISRHFNWPE